MRRYKAYKIIGDKGSTLITVIVAIAFVTILTSIILGTSVMNVRMKAIDRRTKDDFYYAEKALNDIYTGIGQETAKIAGEEYDDAFNNVGLPGYSLSEEAEKEYKENFIDEVTDKLKLPTASPHDMSNLQALLQSYIVPVSGITCTVDGVSDYAYEHYDGTAETDPKKSERIRLIGVQVTSNDTARDFQATISTDIIIETPTMDFLGANVDVTDYSIIANKGLYINGDAKINGNIYAGIHKKGSVTIVDDDDYGAEKLYGGINIHGNPSGGTKVTINGNYIVSKGDINLSGNTDSSLTVGSSAVAGVSDANLPNVYFDTLRTVAVPESVEPKPSRELELNSNVYALNDLELNADNSNVTLTGNYYGYNDKTLPDPTKAEAASFTAEAGHDDADSSAIIVNGSHSTLDMSKIRSLVLMGRAYVDFAKGAESGQNIDPGDSTSVTATAEAVALKTNQQLYLVPTDLLESPNPVIESEYGTGFKLAETKDEHDVTYKKIEKWFGYDFIDTSKMFKTYKVTMTGGSPVVYYAYLNFNDKLWVKDDTEPIGYRDVSSDPDYRPLGTKGSVSSMEAFFDIIMSSKKKHEDFVQACKDAGDDPDEAEKKAEEQDLALSTQPTPYTSYKRIVKSMGYEYFDLHDCIIGDGTDSTILYSQNAVVQYKTEKDDLGKVKKDADDFPIFESTMLKNNAGMERYAAYPQNLFHRYQWLVTYLNANQDVPLKDDPNSSSYVSDTSILEKVRNEWRGDGSDATGYFGYKEAAEAAPIGHFVALDRIKSGTDTTGDVGNAVARGLPRSGYGDCIVKYGDLVIGSLSGADIITSGSTFKGVAIVDGNITVQAGTKVNGLLMATGAIIIDGGGNTEITYDKGLIQARIEKEIANVKTFPESEPEGSSDTTGLKSYYLINYLTQNRPIGTSDSDRTDSSSYMMYNVTEGSKKKIDRIEADYHSFMFYENWQKGPAD